MNELRKRMEESLEKVEECMKETMRKHILSSIGYDEKGNVMEKTMRLNIYPGNVISINNKPVGESCLQKKIKDMQFGEVGYTVPWAYNRETNTLNVNFPIKNAGGGSLTMLVVCTPSGYELTTTDELIA